MSAPRLPLVVTADQDLLDDLLRLAAAGGTEVEVDLLWISIQIGHAKARIRCRRSDSIAPPGDVTGT